MRKNYHEISSTGKNTGLSALGMIDANDKLYSVKHVASLLHRSVQSIRRWIKDKLIPARKVKKEWYILKSELVVALKMMTFPIGKVIFD